MTLLGLCGEGARGQDVREEAEVAGSQGSGESGLLV